MHVHSLQQSPDVHSIYPMSWAQLKPLGFFDPLGFSKGDETNFKNLRAAKIKHGRVSIMGFAALFLVSGALELGVWVQDPDNKSGIFGDPLGLNPYDDGMRLKEINNGHSAMFVAVGIISADLYAELNAIKQCGLAATGTMKSSSPRGLSFAGRSFCARAQSSAVSACGI